MSPNNSIAACNLNGIANADQYGPLLDKNLDSYDSTDSANVHHRPRDIAKRHLKITIPSSPAAADSDELQFSDRELYRTVDAPASPACAPASPATAYSEEVLTPVPCESTGSTISPLAQKSWTRPDSADPVPCVSLPSRKRKAASTEHELATLRARVESAEDELVEESSRAERDRELFTEDFNLCEEEFPATDSTEVVLIRESEHPSNQWVFDAMTGERHYHTVLKMGRVDYQEKLSPYFFVDNTDAVLQLHKVICDDENRRVVALFENYQGGDLHSYIRQKKRIKEDEARELLRPVFEAIAKCHGERYFLRRIKLRNLVFVDKEKTTLVLKNLEEGVSAAHQHDNIISSNEYEANVYLAPEVIDTINCGCYDGEPADVWAAGVVLFATLAGRYHVSSRTATQCLQVTEFEFPRSCPLSANAQNLLTAMLSPDPDNRISMEEVLNHPWFTNRFRSNPRPPPRELRTDRQESAPTPAGRHRNRQRRVPVNTDDHQVPSQASLINQSPIL